MKRQPPPDNIRDMPLSGVHVVREMARNARRVLGALWETRPLFVVGALAITIAGPLINLSESGIRAALINHLVRAAGTHTWEPIIIGLLGAVIAMGYVSGILHRLSNFMSNMLFLNVRAMLETRIMRAKAHLDVPQHEDPIISNLAQKASDQGINRTQQFAESTLDIVGGIVGVVSAGIVLVTAQWWIALVVLACTLPELFAQNSFAKEVWVMNTKRIEPYRHVARIRGYFFDGRSISELKLFRAVEFFIQQAETLIRTITNEQLEVQQRYLKKRSGVMLISYAGIGIALAYFSWQVLQGELQIGTLSFLFGAVSQLRSNASTIFLGVGRQQEQSLFVTDLFTLLETEPVMPRPKQGLRIAPEVTPEIRFEHVTFTYPGASDPALADCNLHIPAGSKIAIVGLNGAGKSTLVKLLCRFYDPTEGRILVNGTDLREIDLDSYYAHFGVLFQEFNRYAMPVREAVAVGRVDQPVDDDRVTTALVLSEADRFVEKLSNGYEQMLGKNFTNGTDLSGGQWQKLALARVFYREPRLYVLDEPTAAIDAESESRIFDRLDALPNDRSVIFISHRFSTVRNAHRIVVIDGGRITEDGPHDDLVRLNGTYARLFALQAERYQ